jgi:hemerythrin
MQWKDIYSIKNPQIDFQHEKLFGLFTQLEGEILKGNEHVIETVVQELIDYTKSHFLTEETIMQEARFPDTEAHAKMHDDITETVIDMQKKIRAGQGVLPNDLLLFFGDWLINHIIVEDQKLGNYIQRRV